MYIYICIYNILKTYRVHKKIDKQNKETNKTKYIQTTIVVVVYLIIPENINTIFFVYYIYIDILSFRYGWLILITSW